MRSFDKYKSTFEAYHPEKVGRPCCGDLARGTGGAGSLSNVFINFQESFFRHTTLTWHSALSSLLHGFESVLSFTATQAPLASLSTASSWTVES